MTDPSRRISSLIRSRYPMALCSNCIATQLHMTEAEVTDMLQELLAGRSGIRSPQWSDFTVRYRHCEGCGVIGDHVGATRW
jgi:hypothetical protein